MSDDTLAQVQSLIEGKLDWDTTLRMLSSPKDPGRFALYLEALQRRLDWQDRIVLPLGPHLFVTQQRATRRWVIQCECHHVFCGWKENWKLHAHLFVRDTADAMAEVYPRLMAPHTDWQVYREYVCPRCGTLHDVEAPTPWYPVIHDFEPDIDSFYTDWVKLPLPERTN